MSRWIWSLGLLAVLGLAESVAAAEPCVPPLGRTLQCTRCATMPCCCPDDYCRKPMPCVRSLCLPSCCDDYCAKPMPCVRCLCLPSCCDDYCKKPMPNFCWPVTGSLKCGPSECCPTDRCKHSPR